MILSDENRMQDMGNSRILHFSACDTLTVGNLGDIIKRF